MLDPKTSLRDHLAALDALLPAQAEVLADDEEEREEAARHAHGERMREHLRGLGWTEWREDVWGIGEEPEGEGEGELGDPAENALP